MAACWWRTHSCVPSVLLATRSTGLKMRVDSSVDAACRSAFATKQLRSYSCAGPYSVIHLREVREGNGAPLTGSQLMSQYGRETSQVIRGEVQTARLASSRSKPAPAITAAW